MVADTMTIMMPAAAHATRDGMIRVRPGRIRPTAASTSAAPRKSWNHRGSDAFMSAAISGGGKSIIHPCAKNASASTACKPRARCSCAVLHLPGLGGKRETERRAAAGILLGPHRAAVGVHDRSADRQADADAIRLGRIERFEHTFQIR